MARREAEEGAPTDDLDVVAHGGTRSVIGGGSAKEEKQTPDKRKMVVWLSPGQVVVVTEDDEDVINQEETICLATAWPGRIPLGSRESLYSTLNC